MAQRAKGSRQSATKNGPDSTKTSVGTLRERARNWVLTRGSPRLMMSMMLAATVGAGFLASVSMHRVGVHHPMLRYPLAVLVAWGMFLALVGIWVWWQRRQYDPSARSDGASWFSGRSSSSKSGSSWDLPSGSGSGGGSGSGSGGGSGGGVFGRGGGGFGGGGASGSFADAPGVPFEGLAAAPPGDIGPVLPAIGDGGGDAGSSLPMLDFGGSGGGSGGGGGGGGGKGGGFDFDLGDGDAGAFIVLLVAAAVAALVVFGLAFYFVYSAPTFFAELLIDGGVGTWLYRRIGARDHANWLATAARGSGRFVAAALLMFGGLGWLVDYLAPGAATIGEALTRLH